MVDSLIGGKNILTFLAAKRFSFLTSLLCKGLRLLLSSFAI